MALPVTDFASNANEQIALAAKVIGRSGARRKVFVAIYTGKKRVKTAREISKTTRLKEKRVLEEAKKLSDKHIITPTKVDGRKAYEKIDALHSCKRQILALAASPAKLKAFPTKRNPTSSTSAVNNLTIDLTRLRKRQRARLITIDDIDSFSRATSITKLQGYTKMPETQFKRGIANILGEKGDFKAWGGENRDLSSTRLRIGGKRRVAAFAFKGPGKTGKLTPGKMGKNGDQIQRLGTCPAEVFLVQYWAEIDDAVLQQLEKYAQLKSVMEDRVIFYGIIDGVDSSKLIQAYPKAFKK